MSVRWDGYSSDDVLLYGTCLIQGTNPTVLKSNYGHRRPIQWDNFCQYGPGVNQQTIIDNELIAARGIIDWWQYDMYPKLTGNPSLDCPQGNLMLPFEAHLLSPYKNYVKFGLMITPDFYSYGSAPINLPGDWSRVAEYRAYVVSCMNDSAYMKLFGMPVLGVYNYANLSAGNKTRWLLELDAIVTAYGAPLYILIQDGNSTARADHLSHAGRLSRVRYGPNPDIDSTPGQYAWENQRAKDVASWNSAGGGEFLAATVRPLQDRRPLTLTGAGTAYYDQPTMPELQRHLSAALNAFQSGIGFADLVSYHAWSENTESGPGVCPTLQEKWRYLHAMKWARDGVYPDTYLYDFNANSLGIHSTSSGVWTKSAQTFGMFDGDEIVSGGSGDYREFTHERARHLCAVWSTGPDRGIAQVLIDGVSVGLFDQYSPTPQYQVVGYTSSRLDGATHRIRITDTNTKNPSSSSNRVGIDNWRIVYNP